MRNLRGDNTLFVHILKNIFSFFENRCEKLENRFGYYILEIEMQSGRLEGKKNTVKYYLSRKKTFSNRYSSDCYASFFEPMAYFSGIGLVDFVTYRSVQQEKEEMKIQNSFFYNDMSEYTQISNRLEI